MKRKILVFMMVFLFIMAGIAFATDTAGSHHDCNNCIQKNKTTTEATNCQCTQGECRCADGECKCACGHKYHQKGMGQKCRMGRHRGKNMIHKFFLSPEMKEKLELTDEQTEKLETLMTTHAKEAVDIKGQIQKLKIDKKQLMKNTKMDISAIESKMKQLYDLKLKYKIHRLKGFQQAREILTDKQRTVVEEIWNKYQGKGKRMMKQGCAQCTHHQMPEKEKK